MLPLVPGAALEGHLAIGLEGHWAFVCFPWCGCEGISCLTQRFAAMSVHLSEPGDHTNSINPAWGKIHACDSATGPGLVTSPRVMQLERKPAHRKLNRVVIEQNELSCVGNTITGLKLDTSRFTRQTLFHC